jgi:hypothetical protein
MGVIGKQQQRGECRTQYRFPSHFVLAPEPVSNLTSERRDEMQALTDLKLIPQPGQTG